MKILTLIALFASSFAMAEVNHETSFLVSQFTGNGNKIFYNCDIVEDFTEDVLEKMGAYDIRVRCSGGLDDFFSTNAFVRASFSTNSEDVEMAAVELKDRKNCHLAHETFRGLRDSFVLENVDTHNSCNFRPSGRYKITFSVLK